MGYDLHVIVNPVSGSAASRAILAGFLGRLRETGRTFQILETAHPGHARELARKCHEHAGRAVAVFGGDGTINEVVSGMRGSRTPILVIPGGTENIFAKYLGIAANADRLVRTLDSGSRRRFDVGVMNGRPFLLVAGIGFDAEVVRRLTEERRGHIGHADYVGPIWRTFWTFRHPRLRVDADGRRMFEGPGLVFVGNVPRYAVGLRILSRARPDDGRLDVCAFLCDGRLSLLRHAWRVLRGRHLDGGRVFYRQARRIRIESDGPAGIEVDGEWAGSLPADFEIEERAISFVVPG